MFLPLCFDAYIGFIESVKCLLELIFGFKLGDTDGTGDVVNVRELISFGFLSQALCHSTCFFGILIVLTNLNA